MSGFHPKDLIAEIKCRPGIYNKAIFEHPRRDKKHRLWLEVGEKLTPREDWDSYSDVEKDARIDEIQAKWKHLKDHFYREIKALHEGSAKKRKYVYFDDMEFMRPFVGLKLQPMSNVKKNDSMDDSSNLMEETTEVDFNKLNDTDYVMEELLKSNDSNNEEDYKSAPIQQRRTSQRPVKPTPKVMARKSMPASCSSKSANNQKVTIKNFDGIKKTNVHPASSTTAGGSGANSSALPSFKIRDGDISFCLSLVPTFRKLGDSTKLRAKIEVLKILHKFVEHVERNKPSHANNRLDGSQSDDQDVIQEDHLEDIGGGGGGGDIDNIIHVKHERADDPLNNAGSGGNTKAWWT